MVIFKLEFKHSFNFKKKIISIMEKGAENCGPLIEAHKECMRKMGFKI